MRFVKLNGDVATKNVVKYLINWSKSTRSKFQDGVKFALRPFWKKEIVYEEFPVIGTKMTLDLVNMSRKIAVEIQGEQHQAYNKFYHNGNESNWISQLERDMKKKEWCKLNRLRVIEIFPHDMPLTQKKLEELELI